MNRSFQALRFLFKYALRVKRQLAHAILRLKLPTLKFP
jgi:hypothetical protein